MTDVSYFRATAQHLNQLVETRVAFLTELLGPQNEIAIEQLRTGLASFFANAIGNDTYICWMAEADNKVVGIGGMAVRVNPGNFRNPCGRTGYIMNMYTTPEYRNKGIGGAIVARLIESAKEAGIFSFELHATKMGEPLYQQFGFKIHNEPTYRRFDQLGS